ncbi:ATP-binding protein [Pseudonocardia sp. KRD291]|uniref:ATP-binding protein n=1 Tax=Pseudonocardia sp. KRD291 TaxID=2792007 RepID=UPI001C49D1C1|nr:ATP-binding protein [Pseudonocardia sp. KRD291]MBW0105295.1 ATP-binding protein [Pseudonocardia sp. KRD291]
MCRAYEPVPSSCALVRRNVLASPAVFGLGEETVEAVLLVANELASNAVDHARTPFRVSIALREGRLRIEVTDGSRKMPVLQPHDPAAARGRGLQMVDHLAARWSCELVPAGKTVAAELPLLTAGV